MRGKKGGDTRQHTLANPLSEQGRGPARIFTQLRPATSSRTLAGWARQHS